jgi:hypothetical protein
MATEQEGLRVVSASREILAGPGPIFELIADPAAQPQWDGNDNLVERATILRSLVACIQSVCAAHVLEGRGIQEALPGR